MTVDLLLGLLLGCLMTLGGQKLLQGIQRGSFFSPGCMVFLAAFVFLLLGMHFGFVALWNWLLGWL